jgi:hypothetical protein
MMCQGLDCVYHSSGICFANELPFDKHQQLIYHVGHALGLYHVGDLWGTFIGTSELLFICNMNNVNINIYSEVCSSTDQIILL